MMRRIVTIIIGTRPEAIKMAPVVWELIKGGGAFLPRTVVTGQHDELLKQALFEMRLTPDAHLELMRHGESLPRMTSRALDALGEEFSRERPSIVLVQGDTISACAGALAAFLLQIPVGHIEAGLRTYRMDEPFPEEGSRQIISRLASVHFAPTKLAVSALRRENIPRAVIHLTGNTVVDALLEVSSRQPRIRPAMPNGRTILLTAHRRENFGKRLCDIFEAVKQLIHEYPDLHVLYPVHPNPNVALPAKNFFEGESRMHLIDALPYTQLVGMLREVDLVLTDSGGLQEEAPVFGKPVLVLRDKTERPEAITAGTACLVGTESDAIVATVRKLFNDPKAYARMAEAMSPFGDGQASKRIVRVLHRMLAETPQPSAKRGSSVRRDRQSAQSLT